MSAKKKSAPLPKVRHTWKIRPVTRVKPSAKVYSRTDAKKKPSWVNDVDWFGDERLTS